MKKKDPEFLKKRIEYSKLLNTSVFPKIAKYEKLRVNYLLIVIFATICCVAIDVLIALNISDLDSDIIGYIFLAILLAPGLIYSWLKHKLASRFNQDVMKYLCSLFGDFKWKKNSSTYRDIAYSKALVIPDYSVSSHDDYFYGTYNGVEITIDEAKYQERRHIGERTCYETVFQGVVIKFSFNKNFVSHTVVKNDSLFHPSPSSNLRRTELEDVVFEKKYDVFTNDEIDARYILTTAFMERLNKLETSFKASKMVCAFFEDSLFISLDTRKDMFDMGSLFKSVLNPEQYNIIFDEFYSILKIVDVLSLDKQVCL